MLDRQIEIKQKQLAFNKNQILKHAREPEQMTDAVIVREVEKIRKTIKNSQNKVAAKVGDFSESFEQLQPDKLIEVAENDAFE